MKRFVNYLRGGTIWIGLIVLLFILIGLVTTVKPAYRLSSSILTTWTSQIDSSSFLYLLSMENRLYADSFPDGIERLRWSDILFEVTTNIKPNDVRSLLGRELPGFYGYNQRIIVAGEGTDYTNLPIESSPPLDVVLEDRDALIEEPEEKKNEKPAEQTTEGREVVFIYNTHNRESFLPHLEGVDNPNDAFHSEVNITKVSERLKQAMEMEGIGAQVDQTDIMSILNQNNWEYWKSYQASKPIIEDALAENKDIQYIFDLHRDSRRREDTTVTIDGEEYAKLFFVIGSDYTNNEKNIALATKLHEMLEEKYPGISKGITQQGGSGRNGVYNQNLADNAILIEFGGVDNKMDELYRSADVFAEVFSSYYWDAQAVHGSEDSE